MQVLTRLPQVLAFVDQAPEPNDVKAGWLAFGIFIALILAVAFLGWSLVKQLRKVDAAEEAGLYDPSDKKKAPAPPVEDGSVETAGPATGPSTGQATERPSS